LDKKWSKSKNKILLKGIFLARISKIKLNFELSDRFKTKRLGIAIFKKCIFTRRKSIIFIITTHPERY
jgi:hypothetical protein